MHKKSCDFVLTLCLLTTMSYAAEVAPLRALLVSGGCCHDYFHQKTIIAEGVSSRANVVWTVYQETTTRSHKNSAYAADDWSKDYDVVVHNECYGGIDDDAFIEKITKAHRLGLGAVNLHCAMHAYRDAKQKEWHKYLGVDYYGHGKKSGIKVDLKAREHPVSQMAQLCH